MEAGPAVTVVASPPAPWALQQGRHLAGSWSWPSRAAGSLGAALLRCSPGAGPRRQTAAAGRCEQAGAPACWAQATPAPTMRSIALLLAGSDQSKNNFSLETCQRGWALLAEAKAMHAAACSLLLDEMRRPEWIASMESDQHPGPESQPPAEVRFLAFAV